jgi:GntR family transcriptional regulator / MocR family aminotransferase
MVKQASGVFLQAVQGDGPGRQAQHTLVCNRVREAIVSGTLAAGTRLPSARQLAHDWRVTRGAVDEAFAQLQLEGLVERRVGDGTYVRALSQPAAAVAPPRQPTAAAMRVLQQHAHLLAPGAPTESRFRTRRAPLLHPRASPIDDFPLDTWRRLVGNALLEDQRERLSYGPSAGLHELRAAISRHLALQRGLPCTPEQVLIINSPLQGLKLVTQALLEPGDAVWVEDPSHPSLALAFSLLRARPVAVPIDEQGLNVARGIASAPQAALVYTQPLVQYPTGIRTSSERCSALLDWAEGCGAWVVEGCFNDELVYDAPPRAALAALAAREGREQRVLLLGTLEGVLFPSLRVSYLVLPPPLMEVFTAMRGLLGDHTQAVSQTALAAFIDGGHMSEHLGRLRRRCRERRDALRSAVQRHLPRWARLGPVEGGMHACLHLPHGGADEQRLRDRQVAAALRSRGIVVEALSEMTARDDELNALVLGYGAWSPAQIDAAMRSVGELLRTLRNGSTAATAGVA